MMETDLGNILQIMSQIDPGPFFGLSIIPYLIFLYWAQKSKSIPKTSLIPLSRKTFNQVPIPHP